MASTLLKGGAQSTLGYTETLMYGHYAHLRQFARKEARRAKTSEKYLLKTSKTTVPCPKCFDRCSFLCPVAVSRKVQDWTFLILLGFSVALFSFAVDVIVERCLLVQRTLYRLTEFNFGLQYFVWVLFHLILIWFSVGFTHIVAPTATGSGIPEIKTIMKGVILKEYLTLRTLVAKLIGLCSSLGSGMPLGKMGPFVHVASITASVLSRLFPMFRDGKENQARSVALLTAGSAVGVSCVFACPIGGVLFSIEVTAIYFAIRNYWRGFFSAICGAFMFRLLAIWFQNQETLTAPFKTSLRSDTPFDVLELPAFIILGLISGVTGALWVYLHRNTVLFVRRQKLISKFLQIHRFIYPGIITFFVASCLFPSGLGRFMAGGLPLREAVNQMFDNRTWSSPDPPANFLEERMLRVWKGPLNNVPLTLFLFFANRFWMSAISTTMPLPCGIFIPSFGLGACLGRLCGEVMYLLFPQGIRGNLIMPGAYAIIGAATFSGAVTHTVSPAIIAFEMTGQISHILPCVLAVMVGNATAHFLQPSLYDAMILIKKLPFLPASINPDQCNAHNVHVEDFMVKDLKFLTLTSTFDDAFDLLEGQICRSYPIVENKENMLLLGAITKTELRRLLIEQLSEYKRIEYFDKMTTSPTIVTTDPEAPVKSGSLVSSASRQAQGQAVAGSRFSISRVVDENANDDFFKRKISTISAVTAPPSSSLSKIPTDTGKKPDVKFASLIDKSSVSGRQRKSKLMDDAEWEQYQLSQPIPYIEADVDPAPFQIAIHTSLYRVHALFSLLNLHHTFVTDSGRLVGIVSVADVRQCIQGEINRPLPQPVGTKKKRKFFCCLKKETTLQS